jgi:hypothetical protein
MVIMDARRRVRKIFGGYSPKFHDGNFREPDLIRASEKSGPGVVVV